jgi:NAD(P)-dependent dehydrogenase (short-subunit alcohol dehydrogenase family)
VNAPSAVVTGAARGLGFAVAQALTTAGYRVHLSDVDDGVRAAAERAGGTPHVMDVRDEAACAALAAEVSGGDGLDLWVNNAGVLATGPVWTHDAATRQRIFEVNALGAINGTLAALSVMRPAGRGHVINVVSLAGLVAAPGETVYSASKHALLAFSIGTLAELRAAGETGVHISCLCPDGIWTPMLHDKLDDPGAALSFSGRLLRPADVAARVVRLARHPRPVATLPRWRGGLVRLFDAFPRAALMLAPAMFAAGRAGQRRYAKRVSRGRWP